MLLTWCPFWSAPHFLKTWFSMLLPIEVEITARLSPLRQKLSGPKERQAGHETDLGATLKARKRSCDWLLRDFAPGLGSLLLDRSLPGTQRMGQKPAGNPAPPFRQTSP